MTTFSFITSDFVFAFYAKYTNNLYIRRWYINIIVFSISIMKMVVKNMKIIKIYLSDMIKNFIKNKIFKMPLETTMIEVEKYIIEMNILGVKKRFLIRAFIKMSEVN